MKTKEDVKKNIKQIEDDIKLIKSYVTSNINHADYVFWTKRIAIKERQIEGLVKQLGAKKYENKKKDN